MESFTRMGEAILLAEVGKQQIARALIEVLDRRLKRLTAFLSRRNADK